MAISQMGSVVGKGYKVLVYCSNGGYAKGKEVVSKLSRSLIEKILDEESLSYPILI